MKWKNHIISILPFCLMFIYFHCCSKYWCCCFESQFFSSFQSSLTWFTIIQMIWWNFGENVLITNCNGKTQMDISIKIAAQFWDIESWGKRKSYSTAIQFTFDRNNVWNFAKFLSNIAFRMQVLLWSKIHFSPVLYRLIFI